MVMLPRATTDTAPSIVFVVEGPIRADPERLAVTDAALVVVIPPLKARFVPAMLIPEAVLVLMRSVNVVVPDPASCRTFWADTAASKVTSVTLTILS